MTKIYRQPFTNDWPITQVYGDKITSSFHTGIDYGCPFGTSILASADGNVVYAGWDNTGYGNVVIIKHDTEHSTLYAHLSDIYVYVGMTIKQGSLIGHSGNTGNSTGPHLHFEARKTWNDYKSHFNPMNLPMTTIDDSISIPPSKSDEGKLLSAYDIKKGKVTIVCSAGAYAHNEDFTSRKVYPKGSEFEYTGVVKYRNNIQFCECKLKSVWIAVNDGETQILDNV